MILNKTFLGAGGIGVISSIYWWESKSLPTGTAASPGIGYVPSLLGEVALGLCVLLAVLTYMGNRGKIGVESNFNAEETGTGPWIIASALLLYPILLENLGFIFGTTALTFVSLWVMGYKHKLRALVVAVVMVLISYHIFSEWLSVQFPQGWLGW